MANFDDQVKGTTGLTISSSSTTPTEAELSTFLNDGVIDVTRKSIQSNPASAIQFQRESAITDDNGFDTAGAQVLSVIREAGADGSSDGSPAWEPCRLVPTQMQSRVVDPESLSFASKYNPAYIIDDDGLINVYPTPDNSNDGYRVFYVNNAPENSSGGSLVYNSSGIKYFPSDKIYLVVLYASIKSLEASAASKTVAQDIELQGSYSNLANSLKAEYNAAFQGQQQQQAGAPARR